MVWVVSDHGKTRDDLVPLISARGYEVSGIECGGEVCKRIRFRAPSVIIVDCGMPDSFEVLASIRAEVRAVSVPIVMFSVDHVDLREKAIHLGADAYVAKGSLDWSKLLEEVVRFAGPPPGRDKN